ncbi:MAG TPA: methylisocitrate lyase [Nitrospiria bacterium]|nr:methylisocitrate lyase [Nitrospiria bacterium]
MKGESKGHRLKELIQRKIVVLPGVYNAFTALLVEAAGFEGAYASGAGLANGVAGVPDIGILSREEVARQVAYITDAIRIPLLVDADTGFGGPLQVMRTVRIFARLGAAGIQIEDQTDPKRCGHLSGKSLISTREMVQKIRAAVRARGDSGLLVVARTDARGVEGFGAATARAKAYQEAGADIIFPEALESAEEFERFAKEVQGPLLANMTEFGKTPYLSVQAFAEMGYAIVVFPMSLFRVMAKAGEALLADLKILGTQQPWLERMQTRAELYRLVRYEEYEKMDKDLSREEKDGDP